MAHNALHDVVHKKADRTKRWQRYLKEIKSAPDVASKPA
jgi:hypothetical protein